MKKVISCLVIALMLIISLSQLTIGIESERPYLSQTSESNSDMRLNPQERTDSETIPSLKETQGPASPGELATADSLLIVPPNTETDPRRVSDNQESVTIEGQPPKVEEVVNRVELANLRTEDTKFFKNKDGSTTVELELKPSSEENSDHGLIKATDSSLQDCFENKSNRFKVRFPKKIRQESLRFELDDTSMSFELLDGLPTEARAQENTISYPDILQNTDVSYTVTDTGVKESIILKDSSAPDHFSFRLNISSNLEWDEKENGRVDFKVKDSDRNLYYISPVYAVDTNGNEIDSVTQEVLQEDQNLIIDIDIDKSGLL